METCNLLSPTNETDLFCLHYVFIPRINGTAEEICKGLEQPPHAHRTWLVPYANVDVLLRGLIFSHIQEPVSEEYGVDEGEYNNPFDEGSVSVPAVLNLLNRDQMQYLALQHDPMKCSDYHGFDGSKLIPLLYIALNVRCIVDMIKMP